MDAASLKRYVFENGKIEFVLEKIGCKNIKYHPNKEFYSCSNYNGDNQGAVNVKNNEYLYVTNWTRQNEFREGSDIFDLIQYNKGCSFKESIKCLHDILGLDYSPYKKQEKQDKVDPLAIFRNAVDSRRKVDVADIHTIAEETLDEYVPMLYIDWFREGIMPWTRDKFGLCYSYKYHRIIIPHRYWMTGELIGMNMRTTIQNYEEFGINKYYLSEGMNKSINLYGLYENYDDIQKAGYVVVFEAEKSVLKNHSRDGHESEKWKEELGLDFNGKACVALAGKTLSEEQARILIGLNVEVVIALDKDVDINETRHMCEQLYRLRNVSYIYDKWGVLEDKQSPADANNKIYNFLFKWRIKYDEKEHKEYIKSLNKTTGR